MGYDTKGIRVLDLGEAGIFLVIDHVRGGSRGDVLGGYDSRSNIFGSERPGSPGKTQTDEGGAHRSPPNVHLSPNQYTDITVPPSCTSNLWQEDREDLE